MPLAKEMSNAETPSRRDREEETKCQSFGQKSSVLFSLFSSLLGVLASRRSTILFKECGRNNFHFSDLVSRDAQRNRRIEPDTVEILDNSPPIDAKRSAARRG